MKRETIGNAGQWFSGLMVLVAIIMEVIYKADVWLVVMTIGSFGWGISTKVKYH